MIELNITKCRHRQKGKTGRLRIDPVSISYPLAYLGLARACAMQNKTRESRQAYEALFKAWNHADPDLPVLTQARRESPDF